MSTKRILPAAIGMISAILVSTPITAIAESQTVLELYVDATTKQIFAEPGPGRVRLGKFQLVDESGKGALEQRLIQRQEAYEQKIDQAMAATTNSNNAAVKVDKKGLQVSSLDGDFSMKLGGRVHADVSTHLNDGDLAKSGSLTPAEATSGTEIRRARLELSGTLYDHFKYAIVGDWAGNSVSMKDLMVTYSGISPLEITVGNQKHAMSMEIEESSNDIMFNERSLLSALTTPHFDRAIGINVKTKGNDWSLQGGLYGDAISSSGNGGDEGSGWAVRGTFAPLNTSTNVVHLGANLGQRSANDNNSLSNSKSPRFRYETTHMSDLYLSDTGTIADFKDITLAIFEGAVMAGPWSIQGEYGKASISRESSSDADFSAWYVQTAWTLTGESRSYKGSDGEFKRLTPANNFDPSKGTWGAWELALRYDAIDLTDTDVLGGEQDRLTLNLNWYMNPNLRVLFGYSRSIDVTNGPLVTSSGGEPDNVDVFNIRTQLAF